MNPDDIAIAWARTRAQGPMRVTADTAVPPGMRRLVEPDGSAVWLVADIPEWHATGVLSELGLPRIAVQNPNETARVLACCVKCCWPNPLDPLWPGTITPLARVRALHANVKGIDDCDDIRALTVLALRQLHQTRWVLFDEAASAIRLGPRVITWDDADQSRLRQLWTAMPSAPDAGDCA